MGGGVHPLRPQSGRTASCSSNGPRHHITLVFQDTAGQHDLALLRCWCQDVWHILCDTRRLPHHVVTDVGRRVAEERGMDPAKLWGEGEGHGSLVWLFWSAAGGAAGIFFVRVCTVLMGTWYIGGWTRAAEQRDGSGAAVSAASLLFRESSLASTRCTYLTDFSVLLKSWIISQVPSLKCDRSESSGSLLRFGDYGDGFFGGRRCGGGGKHDCCFLLKVCVALLTVTVRKSCHSWFLTLPRAHP